jgi:hypothetical protein
VSHILALSPVERLEVLGDSCGCEGETLSAPLQPVPGCVVTVVSVTSGRRELRQAVESVCRQNFTHGIRLLIIGDNLPELPIDFSTPAHVKLIVCNLKTASTYRERNIYSHLAHLRNVATLLVTTRYCCFLDDDNIWEANHLFSLIHLIQTTDLLAVHSWRRLVDQDNNPVAPSRYPWLPPGAEADSLFSIYCQHGVMDPLSAVIRDSSSLRDGDREYGMVDMGEWLFDHELFSLVHFDEEEPGDKHKVHSGEDDKLLREMRKFAIPIACTERPTLRYRLGGISNDFTTSPPMDT